MRRDAHHHLVHARHERRNGVRQDLGGKRVAAAVDVDAHAPQGHNLLACQAAVTFGGKPRFPALAVVEIEDALDGVGKRVKEILVHLGLRRRDLGLRQLEGLHGRDVRLLVESRYGLVAIAIHLRGGRTGLRENLIVENRRSRDARLVEHLVKPELYRLHIPHPPFMRIFVSPHS